MSTDTKTALLDCAEHAARTRGFDGFSYSDLAQKVGIRKASIHYHFPTKAALSLELMTRYYADFQDACAQIDHAHQTGGARLNAFIDRYRTGMQGGTSLCLCVSFSSSPQSLPADVVAQIGRFRRMIEGWLDATFKVGQIDGTIAHVSHPNAEAAATLALLEGAQLSARAGESLDPFEKAVAILTSRIM